MQPTAEQWKRWIEGPANEEDLAALHKWLAESDANRSQWEDYCQLWANYGSLADVLRKQEPPEKEPAWQRLQGDMHLVKHPVRQLNLRKYRSMAAAIALLLAAAMAWIWQQTPVQVTADTESRTHTLPDGSVVALRAGSSLSYPRFFSRNTRRLQLEGEAFFEVKRNEKLPFVVQCGAAEVKVLGTSFLIETAGMDSTRLSVYTGLTAFYARGQEEQSLRVKAGQSAVLNREGVAQRPFSVGRQAWRAGFGKYEAAPMAEILADWQHWHGLSVRCENIQMLNCRLTVELSTDDAEASLGLLATVLNMDLQSEGPNAFVLRGGSCD